MQIDSYSLNAQKTKMKAFCDYNGYEIAEEYEDAGRSGKSIEGREAFSRMMDDIRSGKDGVSFVLVFKLDGNNELHNRETHVSGKFSRKQDIDPIKQDIDPINDPINTAGLSEREKKILELLRQDPTLTRAKMAGILGCSDATVKRALGSMVQKNVIRRIGSNKKGEWVINS